MGQNDIITSGHGSVFFQSDPTVAFGFLTCTGVGDLAIPKGDSTPVYRPDPQHSGQMQLWTRIPGTAGMVTTRLNKPFNNVYNFLLEQDCDFQLRLNHICAGDRTVVSNYSVAQVLISARVKTAGKTAPVLGAGTDAVPKQVDTTADLEAMADALVYPLKSTHLTLASTTDVSAIVFAPKQCATPCRAALGLGQLGYALTEATLYSGIQKTVDYGAVWAATVDTPFTISGNDATSAIIIETATGYRLLVTGGVADPLMPPEISYLDVAVPLNTTDAAAVWHDVYVGDQVNISLSMVRRAWNGRLWVVGSDGHIYYSDTIGATWTMADDGVATTQDLNDVVFLDDRQGFAVGDTNAFVVTTDGLTWAAGVGPAAAVNLLSIDANRFGYLYVATADARIFRSTDGGNTWTEVLDLSVGSIDRLRFDPENLYFAGMVYNTATPVGHFYRSEDGGVSWTEWASPAGSNAGYNDLFVCDPNLIYVGGNAMGGLSYVAKFDRSAS